MLIYLDSNIVIYSVENSPIFGPIATARISTLRANGDGVVVSDLSRIECRSRPIAYKDHILLSEYDAFFAAPDVQVLTLTTAVCDRATLIRAQHRYRIPDILHLAAALEAGCGAFLTNDLRLSSFTDIAVEVLN